MKKFVGLALLISTWAWADGPIMRFQKRATYRAVGAAVSPPATPTDICKISGSASKTVYIERISISSTQTTAGWNNFFLIKRSTDNSAGTMTSLTRVPLDSNSAAAGASTVSYTVNPTLGTVVGTIGAMHLFTPAPATAAGGSTPWYWDFDVDQGGQPVALRGTGEVLAVNFNGAALPSGLSVNCNFTWSEE